MTPKTRFLKIDDNYNRILLLLHELVLDPRVKALDWAKITKQTPNMKIGYPGQHLASLITGVEGVRTGARGDDLEDGTEIKSCSRVDQLDNCKDCGKKLLRIEPKCPHCGSENINRMNDSKWLFSVKSEIELDLLTNKIERIFLTISDYPNYSKGDFSSIRFQAFELWNNTIRHSNFKLIMENYYNKIFLEHIKKNPKKTPAPKNFWPFSYQFYLCNPVKVFEAIVNDANTNPEIKIKLLVDTDKDRSEIESELMPIELLNHEEIKIIGNSKYENIITPQLRNDYDFKKFNTLIAKKKVNKSELIKALPYINEETRKLLTLRDTDKISTAKETYKR